MKGRPAVFALVIGGWMAAALSSDHTFALSERQRVEGSAPAPSERLAPQAEPAVEGTPVKALLDKYCVACHSQRLHTADLVLSTTALSRCNSH